MRTLHRSLGSLGRWLLRVWLLLALIGLPAASPPAQAEPTTPNETPERIVDEHANGFSTWITGGGFFYWATHCMLSDEFPVPAYLRRMPVNLGRQQTLAERPMDQCATFWYMAADETGLYYYNFEDQQIEFRPVDNPLDPPTVVVSTTYSPNNPLELDGDYIYWMDEYALDRGAIYRVRKDGTGGIQTLRTNISDPGDILVRSGMVYFLSDSGLSRMNCASLPCSAPEVLVSGTTGRDLFYAGGTFGLPPLGQWYVLYWVEDTSPERIRRYYCSRAAPFVDWNCSASVEYTATDGYWHLGSPKPRGSYLYFLEERLAEGQGHVRRLDRSTHEAASIAVMSGPLSLVGLEVDSRYVYFGRLGDGIYRLPLDAAAITWDLKAEALEVTQAIQDLGNRVPLVAHKPTYVRAYARLLNGPTARNVEARLHGSRGGSPLPGSPLTPLNGTLDLSTTTTYDRANLDDGWLFRLPRNWTDAGSITLRLEVNPRDIYDDSNSGNDQLSRTVTFTEKAPVCVVFVPVRTHGPYASVHNPNFGAMIDMATRLWPTPGYWTYYQTEDIAEWHLFWFSPYELPEDNWKVLTSLNIRDAFTDDPDECDSRGAKTHYVGMVHHSVNTENVLGVAYLNDNVAWVKFPPESPTSSNAFDWPDAGVTLAHELGHNQGRKHVDCGGPENTDRSYPYPTNQIGNVSPTGYYGFDPKTQTVIPPDDAADYMSYCGPEWTSDYTWRAIFNSLHTISAALEAARSELGGAMVLVSGGVNPNTNQGTLNYAWVYPSPAMSAGMRAKWSEALARAQAAAAGNAVNYFLRLRAPDGSLLVEEPVTLLDSEDLATETKPFLLTFPAPAGTVATVELAADGTVLDSRSPGTSTPTVSIQKPAAGEVVDDTLTLQWQAEDPDPGDALLFTVQYSPDNGATWYVLLTDYPAPQGTDTVSLTIANPTIPESGPNQGRIRVLASDGYHTGMATSAGFTVTNRRPQAVIAAPGEGERVPAGRTVFLRGMGMDPEDGGLADEALSWTLNGKSLGSGAEVAVPGLAPGDYQAQLTVKDSKNQTGSAQVHFSVAPLGIPQGSEPTLDGFCDDSAYADGVSVPLAPYTTGDQARVTLLRTADHLWACFSNMARGTGSVTAFAGVRVDVDNSRDPLAQSDDYGFFVGEDGTPFTYRGNGSGGFADPGPGGLSARVSAVDAAWHAELRIDRTVLGGWNHMVGLNLGHYWVRYQGDDYEWPFDTVWNKPNTWALSALGYLPRLTRLEPASAVAGSPDLSLVVRGEHFQSGAVVRWNGTDLTTQFGSSTVLTATVPAARLASPTTAQITVRNPGSGDFVSNALPFTVESPVPTVTGLSPNRAAQGSPGFTLTVEGTNFLDGAQVLWDGAALPTTYVNGTRLTATVDASRLQAAGAVGVAVRNPGPNAPVSSPATFTVEPRIFLYLPTVLRE